MALKLQIPGAARPQALVCKDMRTRPQPWPHSWGLFSCCSSGALPSSNGGPLPDFCANHTRALSCPTIFLPSGCKVLVPNMSGATMPITWETEKGSAPVNATNAASK